MGRASVGDGSPVPIVRMAGDLFFAERKTAAGASPRPTVAPIPLWGKGMPSPYISKKTCSSYLRNQKYIVQ